MPQSAAPMHARLEALRPAIKRVWADRLRREVPISAMGNPEVLVFLMDETLDQLQRGLKRPDRTWLRQSPRVAPHGDRCQCSLSPLLNYYATGELALRDVAGAGLGGKLEDVLAVFHALAQQEIQTLCSLCPRRDAPDCRLRAKA